MSRHTIASFSARFIVTVGWDRPLNSYFAQVEDVEAAEGDDQMVVWVGASFSEVSTPDALQVDICRYATLPEAMLATLRADRAATLDKGDSQLQRDVRRITNGIEKGKT
jgi:hypothetical protein